MNARCSWPTRLSVNLEAPNDGRLATLAPMKNFGDELVRPLRWIEEIRQSQPAQLGWNGRWPSTTTQFVVGGGDESDLEILATSEFLYKQLKLQRAYFMGFNPIKDTPLENRPAENPWREYRLYQASFLFRDYGFDLEEMPFTQEGNLPLDSDPKRAWAQVNLRDEPVEVNRAGRQELLRVPGVGPKSATTIVQARRQGTLRDIQHLRQLGLRTSHGAVCAAGWQTADHSAAPFPLTPQHPFLNRYRFFGGQIPARMTRLRPR